MAAAQEAPAQPDSWMASQRAQAEFEAFVIDVAPDIAFFLLRNRSLEPGTGERELSAVRQAAPHQMQTYAQALVINAAVTLALLGFRNSALEPGTCSREGRRS